MMKRQLLFLLTALLCAIGAWAADGDTFSYKGLKYTVISETYKQVEVSGYEGEPITLTIPSTAQSIEGTYTVTRIGNNAFYECKSITSVTMPNTVTKIGETAFFFCQGIKNISLPSSLDMIDLGAFWGCGLESIMIPKSVGYIHSQTFIGCPLQNIFVDIENLYYCDVDGILFSKDKTCLVIVPQEKEECIIPTSVAAIGPNAFSGCKIKTIEIPDGVMFIPSQCFFGCEFLESVILPKSIKHIDSLAFNYCKKINSIHIYNPEPPQTSSSSFGDKFGGCLSSDAIIYVPKGSKAKYEAAEGWNYFHDFREMEGTGDDEPELAEEPELTFIEYFIDSDPGMGSGSRFDTSAAVNSISIPTAAVNPGAHLLSVRACDNEGRWSATVTNPLYVLEPMSVKRAEYFVDHDPGEGRGTAVSVSSDGTASFVVPTAGLSTGIHELALRGLLPNGEWITLFENTFAVTEVNGVNDIAWSDDILISRNGGNVVISGEALAQGNSTVEIYDISGIQLMSDSPAAAAELSYPIDRSRGPVVVRVQTPDKRCTKIVR